MTLIDVRQALRDCPLVVSVQASPGSHLADVDTLLKLGKDSLSQGVTILRLEGVESVRRFRTETDAIIIGLIKRPTEGSEVYITPQIADVDALIEAGAHIVAIDATPRSRPGGETVHQLVERIHAAGRLAMGDCDTLDSLRHAVDARCDIISTTLSGYTNESPSVQGPDIRLVAQASQLDALLLAEGRYESTDAARAALSAGAEGVVIGGAINDPVKNTKRFALALRQKTGPVTAIDLGGTWLRSCIAYPDGLDEVKRVPNPKSHLLRLAWMRDQVLSNETSSVGISAGGVIYNNQVVDAKAFVPDYLGKRFDLGRELHVTALNDGLATAWGHARHPDFVGMRVATLAIGSGVGAGIADQHDLIAPADNDYPRLNDLLTSRKRTVEEILGGITSGGRYQADQVEEAAFLCLRTLRMVGPDVVVIAGGVGLAPQMRDHFLQVGESMGLTMALSPFGEDAGLAGAAALVLDPPARFRN